MNRAVGVIFGAIVLLGLLMQPCNAGDAQLYWKCGTSWCPVSTANPLPTITGDEELASPTDYSGTVVSAGVAQTIIPENSSRNGWILQNLSSSDIYVNVLGTASDGPGSIRIPSGSFFVPPFVSSGAVSVYCDTAGAEFTAAEW